jgi:hypothetical protein
MNKETRRTRRTRVEKVGLSKSAKAKKFIP